MEKIITPGELNNNHEVYVKHVMIQHLHTVYYCKQHILEYLQQVSRKPLNETLLKNVNKFILILKGHIEQLEDFYDELNVKPDGSFVSGLRSYTLEAMMAFVMQSKIQFEKELISLTYLEVICAINQTHINLLERMARSVHVPNEPLKRMLISCKVNGKMVKKLTNEYLMIKDSLTA